ncbi:MAG: RND transporter [Deltaproteobacteria bacterium HGW-Deltaproteobacteria-15]|nr:MAG: RND transporter [Deltaproteobacteria bacterium HGW-Deltaproteobacteria-15]
MQFLKAIPLVAVTVFSLTGCAAVGPNFRSPATPSPSLPYTETALPSATAGARVEGGAPQKFAFARELPAQWWNLFRSPELDALIKQGLTESPTLAAARAALQSSRENLRATSGALRYPAIDAGVEASRQRDPVDPPGDKPEFSLYNASVQVSYTLDLFGKVRRTIEAQQALVDYQELQYEAAYLTLTSNIVTTAVREASYRAQLAATREIVAAQEKQLALVKRQFELGVVAKSSVLSQESELARTRAKIPPLEKQLSFTRHALSVLAGRFPSDGGPEFNLDSLHLPEELPVTLPSDLVRQRPDIRASEALLHEASAQVGVATADLYPQINLNAGFGFEALATGVLFNGHSAAWNIGASLLQPVFRGGELKAKKRAAVAAYEQATEEYRSTVLQAFQNVADVLRALETDARTLNAQAEVARVAKANLELIERQFKIGKVGYLSLLIAQRDYQEALIGLIEARADRYSDTAALFQALGGGWWNRPSAAPEVTSVADRTNGPKS